MTVVVTGASGHIGNNLVRELLQRGCRVRALIHNNERSLQGLDIERVRGDVRDIASLRAAFEGAELVYHLAGIITITGEQGGLVSAVNADGARNAAVAALECGVRRMVHTSSVHALVQEPLDQPIDETRARVTSPSYPAYDRTKARGEAEVRKVVEQGLDAVIVHPTGVIGPLDYEPSRMGRVFLKLYQRKMPALVPGGFDFVDVRDVVAGMIAAAEKGRTNESYLLPGHWQSVAQLAAIAAEVSRVKAPRLRVPMWLCRASAPLAVAYARIAGGEPVFTGESLHALNGNTHMLHDKATRELGYAPRPTRESVRDIYAWFAEAGVIPAARLLQ
jgi:dihydroflavonol-4-reductase